MPNLRYVSLSDVHLGEEDSLLTNITKDGAVDTGSPSPVLVRLAECLAELLKRNDPDAAKPSLILNGDVLELALAAEEKAALTFAHFLSVLMPAGNPLFGEVICLAGNHDHHLWETARETQYLNYMRRLPPDAPLEPPWHTTKVFMDLRGKDKLVSEFLTAVAHRLGHLKEANFEVLMAYPNYGVRAGDAGRHIVFHHGHFIEPLYRLMSTAASLIFSREEKPVTVYELEGENFAWIDFFWSAMGRSGAVGENIEQIYEATHDEDSLRELTDSLARNAARRYDVPYLWPDWMEEKVLKKALRNLVVKRVAGKQERQRTAGGGNRPLLSESGVEGLRWYVEELLPRQARDEKIEMPESVAFVFGHTHKPFQRLMEFRGYPQPLIVLNTGGWVVESIQPEPLRGGAVVLIDENLNAVNLRMYNEGRYTARVEEPIPPGAQHSQLWHHVSGIVTSDPQPWRAFGETVSIEVLRRAELLKSRIARGKLSVA